MAMNQKQKEDLLKFAMIGVGAVVGYKILFSGKTPQKAIKETVVDVPSQAVEEVTDTVEKSYYKLKNYIGI